MTEIESRELTAENKQAVRDAFDHLRASFPNYRPRPAQNAMVATVARALGTTRARAVVEAPTGVGKSIAYMLAGVPIALASGRKLVLSTATVNLQEQVALRDLPAFLKATGLTAEVVLAKGRQRYACPRNLFELAAPAEPEQDNLFGDLGTAGWSRPPHANEAKLVTDLADDLVNNRWDGDLDNAPETIPDELKPMLSTSTGACTNRRCAYFEMCPVMKARKAIETADIIVANHALVLASLKVHQLQGDDDDVNNFLFEPDESLLVIDEAHSLPEIAIDAGAAHIHLPTAIARLPKLKAATAAVFRLVGETRVAGQELDKVHGWLTGLTDATAELRHRIQLAWQPDVKDREPIWRAPLGKIPEDWRQLARDAFDHADRLLGWLVIARMEIGNANSSDKLRERATRELGMAHEVIDGHAALWGAWSTLDAGGAPNARWISLGHDLGPIAHASPVSAAAFLEKHLWNEVESIVLTSATLSTGGDFAFLAESAGVPDNAECVSLPSPFDLPRQALLQVPAFPVLPDSPDHPAAIAAWLADHLDWSKGSLVLFSSRRKMEAVAQLLSPAQRARTRVQNERSKAVLLREHAAAIARGEGAVLFGLVSFGEGLDQKGDLVTHVVVTQLPFAVPTAPVEATRNEWYEATGRNPFLELTVPAALRTLTQFCGRLIRTESDTGTISVLDRRLVVKQYGRKMLAGLPPFRQQITR